MEFNPIVHTKYFLMNNVSYLFLLAQHSSGFAKSELANDLDLLSVKNLCDPQAETVAHFLAKYQPDWVNSKAAQSYTVLKMTDTYLRQVAQYLARYQTSWIGSNASEDEEILRLADHTGWTVAHTLASWQDEWLSTPAAGDPTILKIVDRDFTSVAHTMSYTPFDSPKINFPWLNSQEHDTQYIDVLTMVDREGKYVAHNLFNYHSKGDSTFSILFDKRVLTLISPEKNILLAEDIYERFNLFNSMPLEDIIMKLISQGAAYKHSTVMPQKVGNAVFNRTKTLIDECLEPTVSLKYALSLYSTCIHNLVKAKSENKGDNQNWQNLVDQSANLIKEITDLNPNLLNDIQGPDIFCEPAHDLLQQFHAEKNFSKIECMNQISIEQADDMTNSIY